MLFDGVVYDEKLLRRFYSGEELELVGAFSEGVYFNGPRGIVIIDVEALSASALVRSPGGWNPGCESGLDGY